MNTIIHSDVYAGLKSLKDNSIDCAVTSPPYWDQRDYGFQGQIGNESDYMDYISKLVFLFRHLRNKLKDRGIFFLNIGDKYFSKYGKTPLTMIPYKLAYHMVKDGWYLQDILIWYKINHMPSSVKNRFANSYEPVFAFSKQSISYYKKNGSKILKLSLEKSQYNHIAVYPEKLVLRLLSKLKLSEDAHILDPFAGSGTTLKVLLDENEKTGKRYSGIMIESHVDYVNCIIERCRLKNGNYKLKKLDFKNYKFSRIESDIQHTLWNETEISNTRKRGFVKIFDYKPEFEIFLKNLRSSNFKKYLNKDAVMFLGCKEYDIELLYETSNIDKHGWIIRNMIIVESENSWYPVFMIVDDNKKYRYNFNVSFLEERKEILTEEKLTQNYIGYRVKNPFNDKNGLIIEIKKRYSNGYPMNVIVLWNDKTYTIEFVKYKQSIINSNIQITTGNDGDLRINELEELISLTNRFNYNSNNGVNFSNHGIKKSYNGKYKDLSRKNWGASPGARSKMDEEIFTVVRLYDVNQPIISDYLNYKRRLKHLTKTQVTLYFGEGYKHTVGHWFRNDFGGSLPTLKDWQKLNEVLDLDECVTNYVCKTALKLQTVKQSEVQIPNDFFSSSELKILNKLIS